MKETVETDRSSINSIIESLREHAIPRVVKSADLFNQPYEVKFNYHKCVELLRFMGLHDENIRETTIVLERGPVVNLPILPSPLEIADYDLGSKTISIAIDWVWQIYQYNLTLAKEIIETKKPLKQGKEIQCFLDPYLSGLKTKRLPFYLFSLSPEQTERGLKFTDRLLLNASNKHLNQSLIHETKHAVDCQSIFSALFYAITAFISRHNLQFYQFDPQERRAKTEANRLVYDLRWSSIITIKPKFPLDIV